MERSSEKIEGRTTKSTQSTEESKPSSRLGNFMGSMSLSKGKSSSSMSSSSKSMDSKHSATHSMSNGSSQSKVERSNSERTPYARAMAEEMTITFPPPLPTTFTTSLPTTYTTPRSLQSLTPRLPSITPASPISPISFPHTSTNPPNDSILPQPSTTVLASNLSPPRLSNRAISRSQSFPSSAALAVLSTTTRKLPVLPNAKVGRAPSAAMYWSKTPISGRLNKGMRAHSAAVIGENTWIFGGCDSKGNCFRDTWKMDGDTMIWSKLRCIGTLPPVTRAHTCTAVEDRLFIIGGGDGPTYFNETYFLDTLCLTWTKPIIAGKPPSPRRAHTSVLYQNKIIIFGGGNGATALNDLFALDVSDLDRMRWEEIETKGNGNGGKPIARGYHSMNLVGSKLVVFGGSDGTECFSDVWVLDLDSLIWNQINLGTDASFLFPRLSHTSTRVGSYLFIIGGHDGINFANDIILFNLVTLQWETRPLYGSPPSPRGYHAAVIYDSRLFLVGGFNGKDVFDDVFTLDLGSSAFLPQITNFSIEIEAE